MAEQSAPRSYRVITLPEPLYGFLSEMMDRVVREGLLVPDELPFAAGLWDRIKGAQVVAVPTASGSEGAEPPAPLHLEGGADERT
jgi:hypothetical protein